MFYINTFLFHSIIGHLLESVAYSKIDGGILYGYWTPVYGIGAILIVLINYFICTKVKKKLVRPLILFIACALILGLFELCSGIIIEELFGRIFWNYSDEMFSIFKYASLKMMIIWGICGVLFIYVINPFMQLIIKKIPKSISLTLAFLFLLDLIYTLLTISKL